jgi:hypothetical protein
MWKKFELFVVCGFVVACGWLKNSANAPPVLKPDPPAVTKL